MESIETIGVKQLRDHLSSVLKRVEEKGNVIRIARHGKDIVELRPIRRDSEQEFLDRLKNKPFSGGGTGKIGEIRTVKNLKPEMPVSDIVIEDRR